MSNLLTHPPSLFQQSYFSFLKLLNLSCLGSLLLLAHFYDSMFYLTVSFIQQILTEQLQVQDIVLGAGAILVK